MGIARHFFTTMVAAGSIAGIAHAQAMTPTQYVTKAGAGDQYEIQSSKLILTSTHNQQIRSFANKMIADHTKSTDMVKAAAMKAGLHPAPPMLDADGRAMMAQLRAASGTSRDGLYISQQKTAHDKALALQQDYSRDGTSAPLKAAAAKIVPVVEQHQQMLQSMPAM